LGLTLKKCSSKKEYGSVLSLSEGGGLVRLDSLIKAEGVTQGGDYVKGGKFWNTESGSVPRRKIEEGGKFFEKG